MSQATLSERTYINSNLFSSHYLDERVCERDDWDCDDEAREAMEELQSLYELEGSLVSGYGEDALIDNWIDEVLEVLGFGTQEEVTLPDGGGFVDELLFETPTARRDAAKVYLETEDTVDLFERGVGIVEAKQWDAAFNVQFSEQRPYRNASHQTKHYLENTPPNTQWGVLTNGRKWRLYGTNDYETQTYYEVDLPELLERGDLEAFKCFYVLFRPAAFHESGGTTFLDEVWSESETASQELGENLQDNVFTALRVLGRGFAETNDDLNIDPDDEEALDQLKEQSLVFLYRLMFVLYAEARGLIHPENQRAQDDYEENFSLDALRLDIHEGTGEVDEGFEDEFSTYSTGMWSRLEDLFRLIDQGEEALGIPPYNGGLFDHEEHEFLTQHEVSNRYLAEVIYRLSTTQNDEGRYVLADYADLDTRHLGSVYEGLLEHQFRIAPEQYAAVAEDGGQVWKPATEVSVAEAVETVPEGGLYVVNDEGERKATGAYYTPDYVVTYIVEETVGPLVEKIREDLIEQGFEPGTQEYLGPFLRRITDLRILDPAMGSGHFLTKATGYLSEQVMGEVREVEAEMGVAFDEQHVRREIAKECIYGVDLNGMAVELAKLSMWLETLSADRPLAFLDHHFKQGNSLVGSDIEDIEGLESDANGDDQQASLAEFGATREGTIERLMEIYSEFLAIENETVDDVKEMERKYAQIQKDDLRQRLVAMANVRTAEDFGLDVSTDGDRNPYEWMASAVESDEKWANIEERDWFRSAQALAQEQNFFHWKLEFPEVFYEETGELLRTSGFDCVVSNPPYVRQEQLSSVKDFLSNNFNTYESAADLYVYFIEKSHDLMKNKGQFGYIVSNKFIHAEYGAPVRRLLAHETIIRDVLDFHSLPVFSRHVTAYPLILVFKKGMPTEESEFQAARFQSLSFTGIRKALTDIGYQIGQSEIGDETWRIQAAETRELLNRINTANDTLTNYLDAPFYRGILTGLNDAFIIDEEVARQFSEAAHFDGLIRPLLKGSDVHRYEVQFEDRFLIRIPSGWTESRTGISNQERAWEWFQTEYPDLAEHLAPYESQAKERHDRGEFWWELRPCDYYSEFEGEKIVYPVIADGPNFALDTEGYYINDKCYTIPRSDDALLAVLNASLSEFWVQAELSGLRGGFQEFRAVHVKQIPIANGVAENQTLEAKAAQMRSLRKERNQLNLHLPDYLTSYDDGPTLGDLSRPPSGLSETLLTKSEDDIDRYEKLRIDSVEVEREGDDLTLSVVPYVKPIDSVSDEYETNSRGYATLEPIRAMECSGLDTEQAELIESFVPYAVEEAGGFAGFRDNATATITPLDRLESLTLPALTDVRDGLADYREAVADAERLNEKIQRTDDLIDGIVYDLYGLTDEEIEIVEEAVSAD